MLLLLASNDDDAGGAEYAYDTRTSISRLAGMAHSQVCTTPRS